ncbi:MAG: hypothetical protein P8I55_07140 [Crocinitomix sp.]|nr:hypothetical protein [Crocinitomix sp.]
MDNLKSSMSNQITDFWEWFDLNQALIEAVIEANGHPKTEELIQSLDQHILGMGKIKWEIGNPSPNQFTFMLSPNNERELLEVTKSIIAGAPTLNTWTFYYAAQATGVFQLQVYDHNMDVQDVDASSWRAIIVPSGDGRFELILEAANIAYLDDDTQMIAADLILTALLGEEEKINCLAGLELSFQLESEQEALAFPVSELFGRLV